MKSRAAFQGVFGAFSHEACRSFLPAWEAVPFDSFEEAIAAVTSGDCERGVLPVENSKAGLVPDVARLLPKSGLRVLSEHDLPIRHHLMASPGATLETVGTAVSHHMALLQCEERLQALGLAKEAAFDTAGAARDVALAADPTRAAIASWTAAELYGLTVLVQDLQDAPDNRTRFVVVAV